jgi:hypothetical protein
MRIDRSEFGSITIDGKTYGHDVIIGLGGGVRKPIAEIHRPGLMTNK